MLRALVDAVLEHSVADASDDDDDGGAAEAATAATAALEVRGVGGGAGVEREDAWLKFRGRVV